VAWLDKVCLSGRCMVGRMKKNEKHGEAGTEMDAELSALAAESSLEDLRALAGVFRRWDHQLAVAESIRATRPGAFIILEPELHLRTRQAERGEIQALRVDLRRWDRQLRQRYGWELSRREARRILEDGCAAWRG